MTGATATASSGTVEYAANGLPSKNAKSTDSSGRVFVLNATPGTDTVNATKTGTTFTADTVTAYKGAVTETIVEP